MMQKVDFTVIRADKDTDDEIFSMLSELESQTITDGWSANGFRAEAEKENGYVLYIEDNNRIISLLTAYTAADEADITNVAVDISMRRKGLAKILLSEFEAMLPCNINEIFLEVRASNEPAIKLYSSFGYEQIAVRKRFYSNPIEDAIIMKKKVGEN